ncbi:DGKQ [Cervus elaphus hippelaphus]|uniref:DGKQ n=1 Tax=Cervus elaphus hippelaphus TaxID=46360 RepID=A0A212D601_CEREH|nr:DGKQ [Cervus elaphus hippelaphus]
MVLPAGSVQPSHRQRTRVGENGMTQERAPAQLPNGPGRAGRPSIMRLHGGRDGAGRLCPAQGDRPVALGTEEPGAWCAEEAGPVCNFMSHEKCLKHVKTPCTSVAPSLVRGTEGLGARLLWGGLGWESGRQGSDPVFSGVLGT